MRHRRTNGILFVGFDVGVLVDSVGTLRDEAIIKLIAVRAIKKNQIESHFRDRLGMMADVQKNLRFTKGIPAFSEAFSDGLIFNYYSGCHGRRLDISNG